MSFEKFVRHLDALRDDYPNLFREADEDWARRCQRYWERLRTFDIDTIKAACAQASDYHPDRLPTRGQLVTLCTKIDRDAAEHAEFREQRRRVAKNDAADVERTYAVRRSIPDSNAGLKEWVNDASGFDRLHRMWVAESKARNFDPGKPVPIEVARRRWAEFWRTWSASMEGGGNPAVEENQTQAAAGREERINGAQGKDQGDPAQAGDHIE